MITQEQIDNLKAGDKLIFFRNGGVLLAKTGNVFTFANWWNEEDKWNPGKHWWQCQELHNQGNCEHNFSIYDTELWNEKLKTMKYLENLKKLYELSSKQIMEDKKLIILAKTRMKINFDYLKELNKEIKEFKKKRLSKYNKK